MLEEFRVDWARAVLGERVKGRWLWKVVEKPHSSSRRRRAVQGPYWPIRYPTRGRDGNERT